MKSKLAATLSAAALLLAASAAYAQSGPWYGGVSLGQSHVKFDDESFALPGAGISKDESDTGFKIFAGYRFIPNFALEGGFTDFGKFGVTLSAPGSSANFDVKISGFHLDAVGILPIGNWDLFAKVGTINTTTKTSVSASGAFFATTSGDKKTEWNLKYGIGAEYRITRQLGVRAEYEIAKDVGDQNTTGEGDVSLLSAGLTFRF